MKVSVIVPVYNAESYIDKCVNSILKCNDSDVEVLLIDDGSKDDSYNKCLNLSKKDKRIKVFHKENGGVSSARNYGLKFVSGEYVTFVDSDDFLSEDWYDVIKPLIVNNYDIIKYQFKKNLGLFGKKTFNSKYGLVVIDEDKFNILDMFFNYNDFSSVCTSLFKKNIIKDLKFNIDFKYGEDYLFYFEALLKASNIYIIDSVLYYYVYNVNSATNKKSIEKYFSEFDNHLEIDYFVYNRVVNSKFRYNHDLLLRCSYNSIIILLKQFMSEYSYKDYCFLVNKMKENNLLKRYSKLDKKNVYIKSVNNIIYGNYKLFYLKNVLFEILKKKIKKIFNFLIIIFGG